MSLQIKPLEEKRKSSSPPLSLSPLSFSLLPDEITVSYLARVPRLYYSTLSLVSKSFHSLLSSNDLYRERSLLGNAEQCLYVCLWDLKSESAQWFSRWVNPIQTLRNSSTIRKKKNKKTNRQLLVPIPCSNFPLLTNSTVAVVGYEIYVIGGIVNTLPSSAVQVLDCRSHTWRVAPSMNVPRSSPFSCIYDGKIYVIGGYHGADDESWAEVFDTKTQTWERLCCPNTNIFNGFNYNIAEIEGKIYVSNYWNKQYAYDTKQGKWECCNNTTLTRPTPTCVIENVIYSCGRDSINGQLKCWWYDTNAQIRREVEGLSSLRQKCPMETKGYYDYLGRRGLVACGGKLLLMWQVCMKDREKKTWWAEIVVEKRDGDEVWGNLEWVDIIDSIPPSYIFLHLLAVSV